jgi:hypothetical protein
MLFPKYVLEDLLVGSGSIIEKSNIEFFNHISMHKDAEDKSLAELAPSYEVASAYLVHMLVLTTVFGLQRRYLKMASNEKIIVEKVVCLVEKSNFGFWIISIRGHMQFLGSNQKSWNRG